MTWRGRAEQRPDLVALALAAAAALTLAAVTHARHLGGVGGLLLAGAASLLLFAVCGDALTVRLIPAAWRPAQPVITLALGAAASGLVLCAFGFSHVPLDVSLWLTLALGVAASLAVRRAAVGRAAPAGRAAAAAPAGRRAAWLLALFVAGCVGVIPALLTGADTVPGQNPDAHQVVGIAVLFQHVAPQGTDNALPIDTVPPAWRFRYSIFYPLAGASNLSHLDPIRVFPAMSALLMALAVAGFALLAVSAFGAPAGAGPPIAVLLALAWVPLHLAWHPYWNQLWGFALFPYALAFGWRGVVEGDRAGWAGFALLTVALALAYPLAMPYPIVLVGAVAVAYGQRPRQPQLVTARAWAGAIAGGLLLLLVLAGALVKLGQGLSQVLSAHSTLWSGDIDRLTPVGRFAGTGGGALAAIVVLALAALALRGLPRRLAAALGVVLAGLLLLDLRFRLVHGGGYMDFKHLSYVGMLVVTLAAAGVARWVASGRRAVVRGALALAVGWTGAALVQARHEAFNTGAQVTPELLDIRTWAARLPPGASVRIDIPPSGEQLWAVYMLGAHPVDAIQPILGSTYAHAPVGLRADYSLAWRYVPSPDPHRQVPVAPVGFAVRPPVFQNGRYVLRRIVWPRPPSKWARYADTASTQLVEP